MIYESCLDNKHKKTQCRLIIVSNTTYVKNILNNIIMKMPQFKVLFKHKFTINVCARMENNIVIETQKLGVLFMETKYVYRKSMNS